MTELLGEVRDAMAMDVWKQAENIALLNKHIVKPFYILYTAKVDPALAGAKVRGKHSDGGIRQAFRISYDRPPFVLGMLVWFVNNPCGVFEFVTQLSSPPDIPLDPSMLSDKSEDKSTQLMDKAKDMNKFIPLVS